MEVPVDEGTSRVTRGLGVAVDRTSRTEVAAFYNNVFLSSEGMEPEWNGDITGCNPGDVHSEYRDATLRRINYYRAMAGLPMDAYLVPLGNELAQEVALIMIANARISHNPTPDWKCYSPKGSNAAAGSLIHIGGTGPLAIDRYMEERGDHNFQVSHRRWLLFPGAPRLGLGDVDYRNERYNGANAIALGGFGPRPAGPNHVAWPSAGFAPYQTIWSRWSFSYPDADFSRATVSMTVAGAGSPDIQIEHVENGYGDNTLVWLPEYWLPDGETKPSKDTAVNVRIGNVLVNGKTMVFNYTVTIIDPAKDINISRADTVSRVLSLGSNPADVNGDGIVDAADVFLAQ